MRLFVAVILPAGEVQRYQQELLAAVAGRDDAPRLIPPERWHITLAFLGEVDDARRSRLEPRIAAVAAGSPPLTLRLATAGTFPARSTPRVLWAGVDGDVGALLTLAAAVQSAAAATRIRVDRRRFTPHLTLGRWRAGDGASRGVVDPLSGYTGAPFEIRTMTLFRSHLGPKPWYEPVARWRLDAGSSQSGASARSARW
ncbi:MAG: RNA 2',3'-cyclic phosphodiesterase [Mycobacteriales bacterium]